MMCEKVKDFNDCYCEVTHNNVVRLTELGFQFTKANSIKFVVITEDCNFLWHSRSEDKLKADYSKIETTDCDNWKDFYYINKIDKSVKEGHKMDFFNCMKTK